MWYPIEKGNYYHAQNVAVSVIRELEDETMCHLVNQDWRGYNCSGSIFNRGRVYLLSIVSSSFLLHTERYVYVCWKNGSSLNEIGGTGGKSKVAFVYPSSGSRCSCTMIHRDFALEKVRVSFSWFDISRILT